MKSENTNFNQFAFVNAETGNSDQTERDADDGIEIKYINTTNTIQQAQEVALQESKILDQIKSNRKNGLQFVSKEFETLFSHYWELRYGLASKTSLFMIFGLFIVILVFNVTLYENIYQIILTWLTIAIMSIMIVFIHKKEKEFEKYLTIPFFVILLHFILQYTLLNDIKMDTCVFIGYYCCTILFANIYVHLRHKYF